MSSDSTLKKVLVVFGTRPEAIKLAPVVVALKRHPDRFNTLICVTGQHREMLDQMLQVFRLEPDYDLEIMRAGQTLTQVTTASFNGLDGVFRREHPDLVLVQGDTTTVFAAALVAYYHRALVGHVEAGLRTGQKYNPFPEELNRRLTTHIADFHFAPTEIARSNLLKEGVSPESVVVTGNTVIDTLHYILSRTAEDPTLVSNPLANENRRMILVTAHRRESFGEQFRQICQAIRTVAKNRPDVLIVYPVHLNPNVQKPVNELLGDVPNIKLLAPLDYVSFVALMRRADILLTDSGGIQEEGPSLGKPVLVMREVSERPEAIAAGAACLVGTNSARIVAAVSSLLDDPVHYARMTDHTNPYGDGQASARIIKFLISRMFTY